MAISCDKCNKKKSINDMSVFCPHCMSHVCDACTWDNMKSSTLHICIVCGEDVNKPVED